MNPTEHTHAFPSSRLPHLLRRVTSLLVGTVLLLPVFPALAEETAQTTLPRVDMTRWQYSAEQDFYYQTGIAYCASPADARYETMGFYVPGAYLTGTDNGDGTWSCTVNPAGEVNGYTALTAPVIVPVNTPGYAAMAAPTGESSSCGYGSIADYTGAGFVLAFAGARGRDAGAPAGVTDFKAAIRYARYNAGVIPGDMDAIFTLGMSGGGAQSALLGATGDSALYAPYLEAIGAVQGVSDAVLGSMCWCPITNLDTANEAYEWNLSASRSGLTELEQRLSDGMAESYAAYINSLGLTDGNGQALTLTASAEGICQAGTYYDYLLGVVEESLNNFLADTAFPYTVGGTSGRGFPGGMTTTGEGRGQPGGDREQRGNLPDLGGGLPADGERPGKADGTDYAQLDDIDRLEVPTASLTLSGTYATPADYIAALNADGTWVLYDEATNTARITSMADFVRRCKPATKAVGAFDALNATQGENILFGYSDGAGAHFDPVLAALVAGTDYEAAFAADLVREDALGNQADTRVMMYNPMYYLSPAYEGCGTSTPAAYWRIRSGITQGDTALCTEVNLALALEACDDVASVDFATVWGQGHVEAERAGDAVGNFIAWVNDCMAVR